MATASISISHSGAASAVTPTSVLAELDRRLATGPLRHDAAVPFFHFYGGKMQKDVLGA